jgi:citrate lyase subunit alpha/citrate CoA-transferase
MEKFNKLVVNSIGRSVPTEVNGKVVVPFMGVGNYFPNGKVHGNKIFTCANYPSVAINKFQTLKNL